MIGGINSALSYMRSIEEKKSTNNSKFMTSIPLNNLKLLASRLFTLPEGHFKALTALLQQTHGLHTYGYTCLATLTRHPTYLRTKENGIN